MDNNTTTAKEVKMKIAAELVFADGTVKTFLSYDNAADAALQYRVCGVVVGLVDLR